MYNTLLNRTQHGRTAIPAAGGWAGLGLMLGGIGLRAWANTTLGAFYTRTLRVSQEQQLIQDGPYRVLRHPGYRGSLLIWIGAGLATMNWVITAIIAIVTGTAYVYRLQSEEVMLEQTFGRPITPTSTGHGDSFRLSINGARLQPFPWLQPLAVLCCRKPD